MATLKLTTNPEQNTAGLAVIVPGVLGLPQNPLLTLAGLDPGHDDEFATTDKVPVLKVEDTASNMVDEPCPSDIEVPEGAVQV